MISLYNTLTRKKEIFKSAKKGIVGLYTCGPTVYNYAHLGNLRTYVFEDILKRVLRYNGLEVKHVMNITDVGHLTGDGDMGEDKLEIGAKREGKSAWDIAKFYEQAFRDDIKKLNILEPDIWCKATDHIAEQIDLIKQLEAKGFTYETSDGVYFDTAKFPDYNKLSHLKLDELKEGARVEKNEEKKNPTDFALWKFSHKGGRSFDSAQDDDATRRQMEWESPWGIGFPGWHLECSAMSLKYLKDNLDIHCGGIDHINVHHSNEIAQSEAATGQTFFNYWLHGEFLNINPLRNITFKDNIHICPFCGYENLVKDKKYYKLKEESDGTLLIVKCQNKKCGKEFSGLIKMAKSGNNFLTLENALIKKGINPLVYRFACLQVHYRKPMEYGQDIIANAQRGLEHFYNQIRELRITNYELQIKDVNKKFKEKFLTAVNDDLNMPQALAVAQEVLKSDLANAIKLATILDFDQVFGLRLDEAGEDRPIPEAVQALVAERETARQNQAWDQADDLRRQIETAGYTLEDSSGGARLIKK